MDGYLFDPMDTDSSNQVDDTLLEMVQGLERITLTAKGREPLEKAQIEKDVTCAMAWMQLVILDGSTDNNFAIMPVMPENQGQTEWTRMATTWFNGRK